MNILIVNGPNINMLGIREPHIYGCVSYGELIESVRRYCLSAGVEAAFFQSNHEGELIDRIQRAYGLADGIIINPAAYTHTSVALYDALMAVGIPAVEVHLTDPGLREEFRRVSLIRGACIGAVSGKGVKGYFEAVDLIVDRVGGRRGGGGRA